MDDNKQKALEAAMAQIEKQFGKGSVMKMDGTEVDSSIEAISTGSLGLDIALGIGGLPKGRVVEIYGPESSGKTSAFHLFTGYHRPVSGSRSHGFKPPSIKPSHCLQLGSHQVHP